MDFIHAREYLQAGDIVLVNSSHQCNIVLTTDTEFDNYKSGRNFRHSGGHYKMFPARIPVPHADNWNVTLDLGGGLANIRYSIAYIKQ
jgi:uncharacterized protein DUF1883